MSKFSHKQGKTLVPRAGAWSADGYHVSKDFLPFYEEAMVGYLKGNFLIKYSLIESILLDPTALDTSKKREVGKTVSGTGGTIPVAGNL